MTNTYSEKLTNPKWQKLRLQVFNRDNFSCCRCGSSDKELQVHHLNYFPDKEPWEYPQSSLITLCKDCHQKEKNRYKHEKHLLHSLREADFHAYEIFALACYLDKYPSIRKELKKLIHNALTLEL